MKVKLPMAVILSSLSNHKNQRSQSSYLRWILTVLLVSMVGFQGCSAGRSTHIPAEKGIPKLQAIVDRSAQTVQRMRANPETQSIQRFLDRSQGVLIFPRVVKAGFIYGAEGGTGVLLARDESGQWSGPAFYSFGGGSFGLQAGMQQVSLVLVFMNKSAFETAMTTNVTLGMDASVAAGPNGLSSELSTFSENKDIYCFTDVKGVYAGLSLEGGVISPRTQFNRTYYGTAVTPWSILVDRKFDKSETQILKDALNTSENATLSQLQ